MSIAGKPGHSATVDLQLQVNGQVFSLAEVGPSFCFLAEPTEVPTGNAKIIVTIDGEIQQRAVELLPDSTGENGRIPLQTIEGH